MKRSCIYHTYLLTEVVAGLGVLYHVYWQNDFLQEFLLLCALFHTYDKKESIYQETYNDSH